MPSSSTSSSARQPALPPSPTSSQQQQQEPPLPSATSTSSSSTPAARGTPSLERKTSANSLRLPESPSASVGVNSARRPLARTMRSRGRSITSNENPGPLPPPAQGSSSSSLHSPSLGSTLGLPPAGRDNSSQPHHHQSPGSSSFNRSRAPTLSIYPVSNLAPVLEPDTPDKPYSSHLDRLVLPDRGGARSRSASLGERWTAVGKNLKGKEREIVDHRSSGVEVDGRRSVGGWVETLHGRIGEDDQDDLASDDEGTIGSDYSSEGESDSSLKIKVQSQLHLPLSQLHLPLIPSFIPPALSRKPTLSFTAAPPTPPATDDSGAASQSSQGYFYTPSLPTPALSTASLSRFNFFSSASTEGLDEGITTMTTSAKRVTRKEILSLAKNMVPTLLGIGVAFFLSLGLMIALLGALPIPPSLKGGLPKSGSDIKLLSGAIMTYMEASTGGYLHTLTALGAIGIWTHAWSVPGSVVLNILMGALFPAIPAVAFLTLSTTIGGYFSYLLSQPLSPLITLLFPTQLAVVRASIASTAGGGTWQKLFVMRATGLVPWSGMNVACGVVGVNWVVFCATFAAGGLSWNYVTTQLGSIIMRFTSDSEGSSESLSSFLRSPSLIFKLLSLSLLSLLPLLFKPKTVVTIQEGQYAPVETNPAAGWIAAAWPRTWGRWIWSFPGVGPVKRQVGRIADEVGRLMRGEWSQEARIGRLETEGLQRRESGFGAD